MFDHKLQEYLYLASPLHLKGGAHIVQYIGWETRHKQHCSVYINLRYSIYGVYYKHVASKSINIIV